MNLTLRPGLQPTHVECIRERGQYKLQLGLQCIAANAPELNTDMTVGLLSTQSQRQVESTNRLFNSWPPAVLANQPAYTPKLGMALMAQGRSLDGPETNRYWMRPSSTRDFSQQKGFPAPFLQFRPEEYEPRDLRDEWYEAVDHVSGAWLIHTSEHMLHNEFQKTLVKAVYTAEDTLILACRFYQQWCMQVTNIAAPLEHVAPVDIFYGGNP